MSLEEQQELESKYVMGTFARKPVEFVSGNGMTLIDDKGKQYLDFIGGIGVISLGHCAPALVETLQQQAAKLMHVSNYYYIEQRGEVAEKLSGILGGTDDAGEPITWKTFFSNSGAESNECAIKLARLYAHRFGNGGSTIVTITNSFHGRTLATLAATAQPLKQEAFKPLPGGFVDVPQNDVAALEQAFASHDVCAVILEVVQGESGVHPCSQEYLEAVRRLTSEHKALMICDEVQCGMYRCGVPFAFQHYGITPDIVAMAKGIAGGVPMGACAARAEVASAFEPGDHGTTFGGSCLAIAAANCVLGQLGQAGEVERIEAAGEHLAERLAALPHVKEVRGLGLMRAVEFDDTVDAPALVLAALDAPQGLVLNYTGAHTLRFLPPLIATNADIDAMADQLAKLIEA